MRTEVQICTNIFLMILTNGIRCLSCHKFISIYGSSDILASDINSGNSVLNYVLSYPNASYDKSLKGEIAVLQQAAATH